MGLAMGLKNTKLWDYLFDYIIPYVNLLDLPIMGFVSFHMGLAMGLLNTILWKNLFDYIFPYINLLDPSWNLFISIWG